MKKLIILFLCVLMTEFMSVSAEYYHIKKEYPQGSFKKSSFGKITQYDKNGKKIGVYSKKNGKFVKVK